MIKFFTTFLILLQFLSCQNQTPSLNIGEIVNQDILNNIQSNFDIDFEQSSKQFSGKRALVNAPALYKSVRSSVVLIATTNGSSGAGSILDKSGYIITNFHVIEGQTSDTIRCVLFDESFGSIQDISESNALRVKIVGTDSSKDLALLKIVEKVPNLKPISLGRSYSIKIAQDVFAVGHPNGYLWYYTSGTVNRVANHEWTYGDNFDVGAQTIFTQTPINPGNSGGPLLDGKGSMIGINSAKDLEMDNVNYAIRIDEVDRFVRNAKQGNLTTNTSISKPSLATAVWKEVDLDENGVTDTYIREGLLDNGTHIIQIGIDKNEDGTFEYIACDTNSDGKEDITMYDKKGDGKFSYWRIDDDYDGKFDREQQR
jgi:S1-C subfamily serine protease